VPDYVSGTISDPTNCPMPYIPIINVVKSEIRTGKAKWLSQWPCDPNDQNLNISLNLTCSIIFPYSPCGTVHELQTNERRNERYA